MYVLKRVQELILGDTVLYLFLFASLVGYTDVARPFA